MINNIKQLQKLIALCRKTGVKSIKFEGIELELGDLPTTPKRSLKATHRGASYPSNQVNEVYTPGGVTADTIIATDELTEEQLLYYSVSEAGTQ